VIALSAQFLFPAHSWSSKELGVPELATPELEVSVAALAMTMWEAFASDQDWIVLKNR
jgi:hypothetical protein